MNELKRMVPYLLICIFAFYALPLLGRDTGTFVVILVLIMPLICFVTSIVCGMKNGRNFLVPVGVGVLFIPTVFIYYNSSAWVYVFEYAVISLIGNIIGGAIKR